MLYSYLAPVANAIIAFDYLGIAALLLWSGRSLQRPAAIRFYIVLASFILSCGIGHALESRGSPLAHVWHILTVIVSTTAFVLLYRGREQITKLAAADLINERVLSVYPNAVGLYQAAGDDLLILYQNPAAIASLGVDYTGSLVGRVMPLHCGPTPYNETPLLETYLQVARGGADVELDFYYPSGDSLEGWYKVHCWPAGPAQVLISWQSTSHDRLSIEQKMLVKDVRRAIEAREFVLHYQPIINLATGAVYGYEALIRWQKDGRLRSPAEFIPAIERTELMQSLCYMVVAMACDRLQQWAKQPASAALRLAINVSPFTVSLDDFEELFDEIVAGAGIDRGLLVLEITEQALLESPIIPRLYRLRRAGHPLEIDDYGAIYSSLAAVASYPASGIKIDRSIAAGIATDPSRQEILRFILAIAEHKSWHIVGEGIESAADAAYLAAAGVDYGQGYYWAKPGPLD